MLVLSAYYKVETKWRNFPILASQDGSTCMQNVPAVDVTCTSSVVSACVNLAVELDVCIVVLFSFGQRVSSFCSRNPTTPRDAHNNERTAEDV